MTPKRWTINAAKKFFTKVKDAKDAIDGFLDAGKWALTIIGIISTYISTKTIISKNDEIQHKADTIKQVVYENKMKTDTIKLSKKVVEKVADSDPDTAIKYKKLAKILYTKPIEIKGDFADSNIDKEINKIEQKK